MPEAYKPLSGPTGTFTCSAVHFETVYELLFIQPMWGPATAELSGVGRVFGCAVTELYVESHSSDMKGTRHTVQLRRMAYTCNFFRDAWHHVEGLISRSALSRSHLYLIFPHLRPLATAFAPRRNRRSPNPQETEEDCRAKQAL